MGVKSLAVNGDSWNAVKDVRSTFWNSTAELMPKYAHEIVGCAREEVSHHLNFTGDDPPTSPFLEARS